MKQRNFALLTTLAFFAIAAFPIAAQSAEGSAMSYGTTHCLYENDTRTQFGLPTVDCMAMGKTETQTSGGVMGPVRSMDSKPGEYHASREQSPTPGSAGNLLPF